jgi:PAS domain S-box-containing protein
MGNSQFLISGISKATRALLDIKNSTEAIQAAVSALGQGTGVDRCYIFQYEWHNGEQFLSQRFEWVKDSVSAQIDNPKLQMVPAHLFPWVASALKKDEVLCGVVAEAEDPDFKELMQQQDILSFLFTPILLGDTLWGFIGYDDCVDERAWSQAEVDALYTVAKNIGIRVSWDETKANLLDINEALELALQGSKQGFWRWFIPSNKVHFPDYYLNMLGYKRGEIQEDFEGWLSLIHPDDLGGVLQKQSDYISKRTADFVMEYRMFHKDGQYRLISANGKAKRNEQDELVYITGFHVDITEQRKQEVTYRLLSENGGDIIALHHLNARGLVYISQVVKEALGYEPSELIGKAIEPLVHPDDFSKLFNAANLAWSEKNKECLLTFRLKHKEGHYLWFESKVKAWLGNEGDGKFVQSVSHDITERMKAEQEKAAIERKRLELTTLKSSFVAMASHQFRTPLTVIYSNMELLEMAVANESDAMGERVKRISGRVKEEVDRMTKLMNNILIFGTHEARQTKVLLEALELDKLLNKVNELYYLNEQDGRKLDVEIVGLSKLVYGDELLLTHAFSNVLSNAFKYSKGAPAPKLTLNFEPNQAVVSIQDFGVGIPAADLPFLFSSFFRGSNVATIVGTGLGLQIVKEFIEKHNGTVLLESTEGAGTVVTIRLNYAQS